MAKSTNPFRWFDSAGGDPARGVRYPLSIRNVEDLAFERGIDICYESVRKPPFLRSRCSRIDEGD